MLDDRFWNKVDKSAPNGCWEWTSNKNNKGYGMFKVSAAAGNALAHRLSYKDSVGPIPRGALILHSCDNPICVNPAHLRAGNHQQNVADMDERGRRKAPHLKGETNPGSKLTDAEVIEIRRSYIAGEHRDSIAARYGLSPLSVPDLVGGKGWKHLLGKDGSPTLDELKAASKRNQKTNAKVTKAIAEEIRRRLSNGELGKDLAVEYGIHKATISDIKLRKIWAG